MEGYTILPPVTVAQMCSVSSVMAAGEANLCEFVEQEETSIMESQKRGSSEWTDEKHSLYLKSMEASFVDQLYNSLDTRNWQTQNECSSDFKSSRRNYNRTNHPSGQFKVLQHGFWSRVDFKRENPVCNDANKTNISSNNPWIRHFRKGNQHLEKPSLNANSQQFTASELQLEVQIQQTSCSNTEVTDQNFVEEDSSVQKVNKACSKKRKGTSVISGLGKDQAASFWHLTCNRNS